MKRVLLLLIFLCSPHLVSAGSKAKEVAEFVLSKFGKEAVKEGMVTFANRIEGLGIKHGPEVYEAVTKVGVGAVHLLEQADGHGKITAHLLAKFGDDAIVLAAKPQALALISRHGENAALVLLKHKGIAEPIIERFGQPAVHALVQLNSQNGRRLAMLLEERAFVQGGRIEEVIGVIGRFGDRAMAFVWENKGALTVTAVLTAFLKQPEVFINGAMDITKIVGENVMKPVAEVPGKVAVEVARGVDWTVVISVLVATAGVIFALKYVAKNRTREMN